jgi:hypothetical protein
MDAVEKFRSGDGRNSKVFVGGIGQLILKIELVAFPCNQYARIDQRSHGESGTTGFCFVALSTACQ